MQFNFHVIVKLLINNNEMDFNNNHFTCVIGIPLDTDQKSHAKCFACIKAQVYTVFVEIHLKLNQT